jgi:hypothetical protein
MKASDISRTIFIFLIFGILFAFNILSVGIKKVQDEWPTYRCNPAVMPFAGMFGQDAAQNFTYCIQTMQSNYMEYLMMPFNYNLGVIGGIGGNLTTSINSIRGFISNLRDFITSIVQNIFGVFLNILIEFQRIMISIKDIASKLVGVMAALMYTLDGSVLTMQSVWNGAPGKMVRALHCFHPDTPIKLVDGSICKMKNIPLNSKIGNGEGTMVQSVMKLTNINSDGTQMEEMFEMPGETIDIPTYVSGSHLVYDKLQNKFVSVKKFSELCKERDEQYKCELCNIKCPELACLITSNHTIPIGQFVFHDWEDNNGSVGKTIKQQ